MSDWQIDNIDVPGDLEWIDRAWVGKRQVDALSITGTAISQVSRQLTGRPITLITPSAFLVARSLCESLESHADDDELSDFTVTTPEGDSFLCRYRWSDGLPIEYAPDFYESPAQATDLCTLTIRLKTV